MTSCTDPAFLEHDPVLLNIHRHCVTFMNLPFDDLQREFIEDIALDHALAEFLLQVRELAALFREVQNSENTQPAGWVFSLKS